MGQFVQPSFSFGRFFLQRLYSWTGVFSLALFLLLQIGTASLLLYGSQETVQSWMDFQAHSIVFWFEVLFITLPVCFHFLYGLKFLIQPRYNLVRYFYQGNLRFVVQRLTGVVALAFVLFHLWQMILIFKSGAGGNQYLRDILTAHKTITGVVLYWSVMILTLFYWWNGTWNFLIDWGVTVSRVSQKVSLVVRMMLFAVTAAYCVGMMMVGGIKN